MNVVPETVFVFCFGIVYPFTYPNFKPEILIKIIHKRVYDGFRLREPLFPGGGKERGQR
jgi:hypothetical protein